MTGLYYMGKSLRLGLKLEKVNSQNLQQLSLKSCIFSNTSNGTKVTKQLKKNCFNLTKKLFFEILKFKNGNKFRNDLNK